jgi:hypothetical protein
VGYGTPFTILRSGRKCVGLRWVRTTEGIRGTRYTRPLARANGNPTRWKMLHEGLLFMKGHNRRSHFCGCESHPAAIGSCEGSNSILIWTEESWHRLDYLHPQIHGSDRSVEKQLMAHVGLDRGVRVEPLNEQFARLLWQTGNA